MGMTLLEGKEEILSWSDVNLNPLDYSVPERHSRAPVVLEEVAACISCCTTPLPVFWSVLSFEKTPFNGKDQSRSSGFKQTRIVIGPCWDNSNKQLTAAECAGEREREEGNWRHKWKKIASCTVFQPHPSSLRQATLHIYYPILQKHDLTWTLHVFAYRRSQIKRSLPCYV